MIAGWPGPDGEEYALAFDQGRERRVLILPALFEHAIDRDGVEWVDFGTGDDSYKRDWMEQVRARWRLTCWRPERPRNWLAIGRAWARKLVSRPPAG